MLDTIEIIINNMMIIVISNNKAIEKLKVNFFLRIPVIQAPTTIERRNNIKKIPNNFITPSVKFPSAT